MQAGLLNTSLHLESEFAAQRNPFRFRQSGLRSRTDDEFVNNLDVAVSLHARASAENWRAKSHEILPLPVGIGIRVEYWLPFIIMIDGEPLVPFFDPRRSMRLTEVGKRFVFSMMHERIRVADPTLSKVRLGIFQFDQTEGGGRVLRLHTDEGAVLYTFAELDQMIAETYQMWQEVLTSREVETRRRANEKRGSLL